MNKIELLAPSGNIESFIAAVSAGEKVYSADKQLYVGMSLKDFVSDTQKMELFNQTDTNKDGVIKCKNFCCLKYINKKFRNKKCFKQFGTNKFGTSRCNYCARFRCNVFSKKIFS